MIKHNLNHNAFNYKAQIYAESRPSYSNNYVNLFCKTLQGLDSSIVADIAAGTGIHTKLLSRFAEQVYAIEPNVDMRSQCEKFCAGVYNIKVINSQAEATLLESHSVDVVTIAQAFQLLNTEGTRKECCRVLKSNGKAILIWNSKETKNKLFFDMERILLKYCPNYSRELHVLSFEKNSFSDFFSEEPEFHKFIDDNCNYITQQEFIGRACSASYALAPNAPNFSDYQQELIEVFKQNAKNNLVEAPLSTVVYIGRVF